MDEIERETAVAVRFLRAFLWLVTLVTTVVFFPLAAGAQTQPELDLTKLPPMRGVGVERYRDWFLTSNLPRAWAVGTNGVSAGWRGGKDGAIARDGALRLCTERGGTDCTLYAEGLDVVWHGAAATDRARPPVVADAHFSVVPDARFFWFGPATARGVIVWGHGFGGPNDDERGLQPPAFLRPFNNEGFDVLRFDRDPVWDSDADQSAAWLRQALAEVRRDGWRMVVAGGQSRGGWNALQMLLSANAADAVIALSAARTGRDAGNQILKGEVQLWNLAHDVPQQETRLVYIQFQDDPFAGDEDRRAQRIRDIVAPKIGGLLLIDRPEGLTGHMGGFTQPFADRFGRCIFRFVTMPGAPNDCPAPKAQASN